MSKQIKVLITFLFLCLLIPVVAQHKPLKQLPKSKRIDGIWYFKGQRLNGGQFMPSTSNTFKYIQHGKFITFKSTFGSAYITGQGGIKIKSDSVLFEKIEKHLNSSLNHQKNKLNYKLKDGKFLYVRFYVEKSSLGQTINTWYEEVWEKVEMPGN